MNWKKVAAIIKREYVQYIHRKAFWIFTILMPVIWIGFFGISIIAGNHVIGRKKIAVLDETGQYFAPLQAEIAGGDLKDKVTLIRKIPGAGGVGPVEEQLKKDVNAREGPDKIDGFLILDKASLDKGEVEYWAASVSDFTFQDELTQGLNKAVLRERLAQKGVSPDVISEVAKRVSLEAKSTSERSTAGFVITIIFFFFLYGTLIQYGMYNLRGVIEEKSNRIVEVVISSVRPTELMLGKIVGIGLVGLTQYAIWAVLAMNLAPMLAVTGLAAMMPGGKFPSVALSTILFFILYFVLGYFLYASIYTAIGAPFNSDQEAQQFAMFPTWLLVIPLFFWWIIANSPNATFSVVASLIPFFTPTVMFMRVTITPVPPWQILLSIGIMLGSILAIAWFAGKIYRVGILMYGKKPTIPEILRWVKGSTERPAAVVESATEKA